MKKLYINMKKLYIIIMVLIIVFICSICILLQSDYYNSCKLEIAIRDNNVEKIEQIIEKCPGAVNCYPTIMPRWWTFLWDYPVYYPLQTACQKGNLQIVEILVNNGADVNVINYAGYSPLYSCFNSSSQERYQIAMLLIENGADINAKMHNEYIIESSIIFKTIDTDQCKQDSEKVFSYLIENADMEGVDCQKLFYRCAFFGNIFAARKLMEFSDIDVDYISNSGDTALIHAVKGGNYDFVEYLLSEGADKTIEDAEGKTAYDHAVEGGYLDIAELLE